MARNSLAVECRPLRRGAGFLADVGGGSAAPEAPIGVPAGIEFPVGIPVWLTSSRPRAACGRSTG